MASLRLAYLCAPYCASNKMSTWVYNGELQKLGEWVGETQEYVPITPYMLLTQFGEVWDDWPNYSLALMDKCDVMFIYDADKGETESMREEQHYWNFELNRHDKMHYVFTCAKCGTLTLEDDCAECGKGFCPNCCEKCTEPRGCQYADESEVEE